jgi:methylmalonyl-CoA/ethylmalonyl-CoA epimerase
MLGFDKNGPGTLIQIGIVVRDIHASVESYKRILGIQSDEIAEYGSGVKICHLYLPNATHQIELLEPTREDTIWGVHLREKGEGFHHVCFDVTDYAQVAADFAAKGIECLRTRDDPHDPRVKISLFDTSELGFITEIVNRAEMAERDRKAK